MKKDDLGDRMKSYEMAETSRRFMPMLPIYARIDGRSFSKFTKGAERPFDEVLSKIMIETTKYLVKETNAVIGYTQSDEISLMWYQTDYKSDMLFCGKIQKLVSNLAAMTSVKFNSLCENTKFEERAKYMLPIFDCRMFQLPSKLETANVFLWREKDATKNAISMSARSMYSHKMLQGKSSSEMQELIFQKGQNFNDYPAFFKRGTFVHKVNETRIATQELIDTMPTASNIKVGEVFTRSKIVELDMPNFSTVTNRVNVIFDGENPLVGV